MWAVEIAQGYLRRHDASQHAWIKHEAVASAERITFLSQNSIPKGTNVLAASSRSKNTFSTLIGQGIGLLSSNQPPTSALVTGTYVHEPRADRALVRKSNLFGEMPKSVYVFGSCRHFCKRMICYIPCVKGNINIWRSFGLDFWKISAKVTVYKVRTWNWGLSDDKSNI